MQNCIYVMLDLPEPKLSIIKLYRGEKVEPILPDIDRSEYRLLSESCEDYMMTYYPFLYTTEKEVDKAHLLTLQSNLYEKDKAIEQIKQAIQIYHRYNKPYMLNYAYNRLILLEKEYTHIREKKRNYLALIKKYPENKYIEAYYKYSKMLMYDENKYSVMLIRYNSDIEAFYIWLTRIFKEHHNRDEIIELISSIKSDDSDTYQKILLIMTKCLINSNLDNKNIELTDKSYISKIVRYAISYMENSEYRKFAHEISDPYLSYHHYLLEILHDHVDLNELLNFSKIHGLGDIEYIISHNLGIQVPNIDILYNTTKLFKDDLHSFALFHYSNELFDEMRKHDYKEVNNVFSLDDDDYL